jgi:general secretion pathway protein A
LYEPWYGFREKPFSLTPDPRYLYLSPRHAEAFAHLEFGRRERGGFIVITGEVGTGKTTLARYFLSKLGPETRSAVVLYPALTAAELLRTILDDLHVRPEGDSLKSLVDALHRFLLESRAASRDVVLLIDEAQDLSAEVLEQVRLLSNLETDTDKLIQIILMGQSELRDLLARHDLRQLAQRVTARYHLGPLDAAETDAYVRHRIAVAGGEGKVGFTRSALTAVHTRSGGVPRLTNLICDRALLAGYVSGSRTITAAMVTQAADEVDPSRARPPRRWRHFLVGTALTLLLAAAAFALAPRLARAPAGGPAALTGGAPTAAGPADGTARELAGPGTSGAPAAAEKVAPSRALEAFLRAAETQSSFDHATARVGRAWGVTALAHAALRTHMDQLRALDLPAVLELFHPSRVETCYVALVGLGKETAVVSFGAEPDATVPVSQLETFWTRNANVAWAEPAGLPGDRPGLEAWTRERLAACGYSDPYLPEAVRRFQADAGLVSDGLPGPRTRMALFARTSRDHPALAAGGVR